jgi:large-conductance mechanosensitive channel
MGVENQVLVFALAIHVGGLMTKFFDALTRDLVMPLISPISPAENGVSKWIVQLGTIKINIGDLIVQTINILVAFGIVYVTLPYIKEYVPVAGRR